MRPTYLGFKNPKEISQAPVYPLSITKDGTKLLGKDKENIRKINPPSMNTRFHDPYINQAILTSNVGPGKYDPPQKSIAYETEKKGGFVYKGDLLGNQKGELYTYIGPVKVVDLAFLQQKLRKQSLFELKSTCSYADLHLNSLIERHSRCQSLSKIGITGPKTSRSGSMCLADCLNMDSINHTDNLLNEKKASGQIDVKSTSTDFVNLKSNQNKGSISDEEKSHDLLKDESLNEKKNNELKEPLIDAMKLKSSQIDEDNFCEESSKPMNQGKVKTRSKSASHINRSRNASKSKISKGYQDTNRKSNPKFLPIDTTCLKDKTHQQLGLSEDCFTTYEIIDSIPSDDKCMINPNGVKKSQDSCKTILSQNCLKRDNFPFSKGLLNSTSTRNLNKNSGSLPKKQNASQSGSNTNIMKIASHLR